VSASVGVLIETWKIKKALIVRIVWTGVCGGAFSIPCVSFVDRHQNCAETRRHDNTAMAHLSLIMYPIVVGYACFSLLYNEHRSWYAWILSSLVSFVYMFGFLMMTPQLYINYKLKSVAHMPWRAMVYKALNTFIDDLFAFIIKMPAMHRISCFRDDVIFVVYVYQRYIYPVDSSRRNEFGTTGDEHAASNEQARLQQNTHDVDAATEGTHTRCRTGSARVVDVSSHRSEGDDGECHEDDAGSSTADAAARVTTHSVAAVRRRGRRAKHDA